MDEVDAHDAKAAALADAHARQGAEASAAPTLPPKKSCDWFEVDGNRLRLLFDGRQAFPAMLEAIARAQREILLEMYWIQSDTAGHMFRDALTARAREGVDVKVSFDSVGSIGLPWSMWEPLLAAGGQVVEFAPLSPLRSRFQVQSLNRRDHRKILVVDGETAFTGGMNIGDPWLPREQGGQDWRDDGIEVRGPAARDLRALFFDTWKRSGGEPPKDVIASPSPSPHVVVLANRRRGRPGIRRAYLRGIRNAKDRIDITNPYFLPGPIFLAALRGAQRRGVKIRVLLPGTSDVWLVSLAMSSVIGRLLEHGVRVFTFQNRILHAKTAVFDETLTTVGTYNLDPRSRLYNAECNVAVYDTDVARAARASFEEDLLHAVELSSATWTARPIAHRVLAWFAYPLRQFL